MQLSDAAPADSAPAAEASRAPKAAAPAARPRPVAPESETEPEAPEGPAEAEAPLETEAERNARIIELPAVKEALRVFDGSVAEIKHKPV